MNNNPIELLRLNISRNRLPIRAGKEPMLARFNRLGSVLIGMWGEHAISAKTTVFYPMHACKPEQHPVFPKWKIDVHSLQVRGYQNVIRTDQDGTEYGGGEQFTYWFTELHPEQDDTNAMFGQLTFNPFSMVGESDRVKVADSIEGAVRLFSRRAKAIIKGVVKPFEHRIHGCGNTYPLSPENTSDFLYALSSAYDEITDTVSVLDEMTLSAADHIIILMKAVYTKDA